MLPAYAKAHGYSFSVREGWLTGCLNRIIENKKDDEKITLGVAAVKVNGKSVIAGNIDTHNGSLLIDYGNEVYTGKAPCFMYGGFQTMSSWSPAKKARGK